MFTVASQCNHLNARELCSLEAGKYLQYYRIALEFFAVRNVKQLSGTVNGGR